MSRWPVTLSEGPIELRPLRRRDREAWDAVRLRNHAWLQEWEATLPPGGRPGPKTFTAFVRMMNRQARRGTTLPWLVWVDDRLAGQLTVSNILYGSANGATLGYWIDQALAGRGIIPMCVALATDHCLGQMGLHRMEIAIRPENSKSLRVVEKLGFRPEGVRRSFLHINGEWRDHAIFALTEAEMPPGGLVNAYKNGGLTDTRGQITP